MQVLSNTLVRVGSKQSGERLHTDEETGAGGGWEKESVGGGCCVLRGQLRLSGCFKCNAQAEHNYTGMGILKDTEGSHCGERGVRGRVSCRVRVDVRERCSSAHVQSCKLLIQLLPG